jgi:hypothetical protein
MSNNADLNYKVGRILRWGSSTDLGVSGSIGFVDYMIVTDIPWQSSFGTDTSGYYQQVTNRMGEIYAIYGTGETFNRARLYVRPMYEGGPKPVILPTDRLAVFGSEDPLWNDVFTVDGIGNVAADGNVTVAFMHAPLTSTIPDMFTDGNPNRDAWPKYVSVCGGVSQTEMPFGDTIVSTGDDIYMKKPWTGDIRSPIRYEATVDMQGTSVCRLMFNGDRVVGNQVLNTGDPKTYALKVSKFLIGARYKIEASIVEYTHTEGDATVAGVGSFWADQRDTLLNTAITWLSLWVEHNPTTGEVKAGVSAIGTNVETKLGYEYFLPVFSGFSYGIFAQMGTGGSIRISELSATSYPLGVTRSIGQYGY